MDCCGIHIVFVATYVSLTNVFIIVHGDVHFMKMCIGIDPCGLEIHLFAMQSGPFVDMDYHIETEMVLIMIITIAKIVFQVVYFCGPYSKYEDYYVKRVYLILNTLNSAFGDDIGRIIHSFLPLFYRYQNIPNSSTAQDPEILLFARQDRYDRRYIPQDLICGVIDLNAVLSHGRATQLKQQRIESDRVNTQHRSVELRVQRCRQTQVNYDYHCDYAQTELKRREHVELQKKYELHRRRQRHVALLQQTELSKQRLQRFAVYQLRQRQSLWDEQIQQLKHNDESLSCLSNIACPPTPRSRTQDSEEWKSGEDILNQV
eukprot:11648_1